VVVGVTSDLTSRYNAVDLVRVASERRGKARRRPDMAQAGDPTAPRRTRRSRRSRRRWLGVRIGSAGCLLLKNRHCERSEAIHKATNSGLASSLPPRMTCGCEAISDPEHGATTSRVPCSARPHDLKVMRAPGSSGSICKSGAWHSHQLEAAVEIGLDPAADVGDPREILSRHPERAYRRDRVRS